jgi:hypothetical protein
MAGFERAFLDSAQEPLASPTGVMSTGARPIRLTASRMQLRRRRRGDDALAARFLICIK